MQKSDQTTITGGAIRISCSFPADCREETVWEDGGKRCRKVTFSYEGNASADGERKIEMEFSFPVLDISGRWFPTCGFDRSLKADWFPGTESMAARSAPVCCFFNAEGTNRYTLALSEAKQKLTMQYGIHEEDGWMLCRIVMELPRGLFAGGYEMEIWESGEEEPWWKTLARVTSWWEERLKLHIMKMPEAARKPLYSFWYSRHQDVTAQNVEQESRLAAGMGFSSIIVDDGWQTDDNNRGYAFCGDWEPSATKFPDFAGHIAKVQEMGLKYLIWFSVPYMGKRAKAWERFQDKLLCYSDFQKAGILDIRYPDVREYLKGIYRRAVAEWKVDGLKLDFIDEFSLRPESPAFKEGMDVADVQEALNILLTEVAGELQALNPDILIEFRQRYIGPQIRQYGNLLRVSDCPGSAITNRVGTIDLRLLSGETAVHSDMLMWNGQERPQDAALQVLSCLFATVQISVSLETVTNEMKKMLLFWMRFMVENTELLQKAQIRPQEPENLYPAVSVENERERISVRYARGRVEDLRNMPGKVTCIQASKGEEICFRLPETGSLSYRVLDCMGNVLETGSWSGSAFGSLYVPTGGMVEIV